MIKKSWVVLLLSIFVMLTFYGGTALAEGNINVLYGQKNLDSDDWGDFDEQTEVGVMLDVKGQSWPMSIAIDLLYSQHEETESGVEVEAETREINIGVRKYWPVTDTFKPYLGGGLAIVNGEFSVSFWGFDDSVDDSAFGFWFGGGVAFTVAEHLNIGADLRFSQAEIEIVGIDLQAGGSHFLLFLGFHF